MVRILKERGHLDLLKGLVAIEGSCSLPNSGLNPEDFDNIPYMALKGDYTATGEVCQTTVDQINARRAVGHGGRERGIHQLDELRNLVFKGTTHMMMLGTIIYVRLCAVLVGAFAAGSLLTARFMKIQQARADSNRVYELRMYHTFPSPLAPLETRFRNGEVKVFEKNHMNFMGAWVPQDAPNHENLFIYLLAHENRDAAKKNWAAFGADPDWKTIQKVSEADGKIVERVESTFMDPMDFSPLK